MHKSDVNGENELPLYTFLKSERGFEGFTGEKADFMNAHVGNLVPNFRETSDIKWNFTKFLVDRKGNIKSDSRITLIFRESFHLL